VTFNVNVAVVAAHAGATCPCNCPLALIVNPLTVTPLTVALAAPLISAVNAVTGV
jgi:hypothetical protein